MSERIEVYTEALSGEISGLGTTINTLQQYVSFMKSKTNSVADDFMSVNYDKICEYIESCSKSLENMGNNLKETANFLNKIIAKVDEYAKCSFDGE